MRAPNPREPRLRTHPWPVLLWVGSPSAGLSSDRGWHASPSATLSRMRSRCSSWLCCRAFVVESKRVHLCYPPRCRRCQQSPHSQGSLATVVSHTSTCAQRTCPPTLSEPLYPPRPSGPPHWTSWRCSSDRPAAAQSLRVTVAHVHASSSPRCDTHSVCPFCNTRVFFSRTLLLSFTLLPCPPPLETSCRGHCRTISRSSSLPSRTSQR